MRACVANAPRLFEMTAHPLKYLHIFSRSAHLSVKASVLCILRAFPSSIAAHEGKLGFTDFAVDRLVPKAASQDDVLLRHVALGDSREIGDREWHETKVKNLLSWKYAPSLQRKFPAKFAYGGRTELLEFQRSAIVETFGWGLAAVSHEESKLKLASILQPVHSVDMDISSGLVSGDLSCDGNCVPSRLISLSHESQVPGQEGSADCTAPQKSHAARFALCAAASMLFWARRSSYCHLWASASRRSAVSAASSSSITLTGKPNAGAMSCCPSVLSDLLTACSWACSEPAINPSATPKHQVRKGIEVKNPAVNFPR